MTDRINKGDLSTYADINRRDEIGELAESLNRLQKALQSGGKLKAAAWSLIVWGGREDDTTRVGG